MIFTEVQQKILTVSKKLFSEKGYTETSMRDIAGALNLKAGSLYSHFSSKEEILMIICNEIYESMVNNMNHIREMEADAKEKFLEYVKIHIYATYKFRSSFEIYYKYWSVLETRYENKYRDINFEYFTFITEILNNVFSEEEEKKYFVDRYKTLFVIDLLNSANKIINPEHLDLDSVVENYQKWLLNGIS